MSLRTWGSRSSWISDSPSLVYCLINGASFKNAVSWLFRRSLHTRLAFVLALLLIPERLLKVGVLACDEITSLLLGIWQAKEWPGFSTSFSKLRTDLVLRPSETWGAGSLLLRVGLYLFAPLSRLNLFRSDELSRFVPCTPGHLNLLKLS